MYALKDSEEIELMRDLNMQKPATGRCAFCPDWVIEGTAEEVTVATTTHRLSVHQITPKKAKRGTGRPCTNGSCENPATIRRGRFAGWCSVCRDQVLKEEKAEARRERERQRALAVKAVKAAPKREPRKERPKRQRAQKLSVPRDLPHPLLLMTPERADEVLRLYGEGHSAVSIGRNHWQRWGYRNEKSLTQMVYALLKKRGIPRRSRSESALLTLEREGPRSLSYIQPSLMTKERLEVVSKLVESGCSVRSVAMIAWNHWGFSSVDSCREAILRHGRRHGASVDLHKMKEIPLVSREEAKELIGAV